MSTPAKPSRGTRAAAPKRAKAGASPQSTPKKASDKRATDAKPKQPREGTKLASLIALLSQKQGATIGELAEAAGWQAHSVRGAISGALKKKLGLTVESEIVAGRGRVYRIVERG